MHGWGVGGRHAGRYRRLDSRPVDGVLSVQGSGFRVQGSGFRVQGSGFRVQGSGFRVQGSGFRLQGSGIRVQGSGFRVQGVGFWGLSRQPSRSDQIDQSHLFPKVDFGTEIGTS